MKEIIITILLASLFNTIFIAYKSISNYENEWIDIVVGGVFTWILFVFLIVLRKPLEYICDKYKEYNKNKLYSEKKIEKICYKIIKSAKKDKYRSEYYYDLSSSHGDFETCVGYNSLMFNKPKYEWLNKKFNRCIYKQKEQTIKILQKYFIPVTEEIMEQDGLDEYYIYEMKDKGLMKIKC